MTSPALRTLCAAAILLLAGCARFRLNFSVVDASSGAPISAARVKIRERGYFYYFYTQSHDREAGQVTAGGLIKVRGIRPNDLVLIEAPGYLGATAGVINRNQIAINSPSPLLAQEQTLRPP